MVHLRPKPWHPRPRRSLQSSNPDGPRRHNPRTTAPYSRHTACGHCAPCGRSRCPACLRRPPSGVCLRRSRPHPHPKGTPRARSGTAPATGEAGGRGRNHQGTRPTPHGSLMVSPPHPLILQPPGPPDGPRYAGQTPGGTGRRTASEEQQRERPKLGCGCCQAGAEPRSRVRQRTIRCCPVNRAWLASTAFGSVGQPGVPNGTSVTRSQVHICAGACDTRLIAVTTACQAGQLAPQCLDHRSPQAQPRCCKPA